MKRLLSLLLAATMVMAGAFGVAAQDSTSVAYAEGLDAPATWTDDRGNEVATVEVNEINPEWSDFSEYSAPERGQTFVAVTFTVTNISDSSLIVENYDFSLVDNLGRNNGRAYVSVDEAAEGTIFEEDTPLAAGESGEFTLVYMLPLELEPTAFVWQPDSGVLIIVNFGEATEGGAVVTGFNNPTTWTDERGNQVATLEVTEIEDGWSDHSEYATPGRGMIYRAVHVKIENISGASLIIEPYDFSMVDSNGYNVGRSYVDKEEGSDANLLRDDVPLGADETFEGIIVFEMYEDLSPNALLWQPGSGLLNMVVVGSDSGSEGTPTSATPEVDDEGEEEDVAATPDATEDEDEDAGLQNSLADSVATGDSDDEEEASASPSAAGNEVEVNGEPVVISDTIGDEQGTVKVVSTLDGWEDYDEAANAPIDGTRFFLVTLEVEVTSDLDMPMSPLDFTVVTESGGEYQADLYLQADDAEVEITQSGSQMPAGETTTLVIPFEVPDEETPVSVIWETGQDTIELDLVP